MAYRQTLLCWYVIISPYYLPLLSWHHLLLFPFNLLFPFIDWGALRLNTHHTVPVPNMSQRAPCSEIALYPKREHIT